MKKITFVFIIFCFPIVLIAQPNITSSVNPAIGDVYNFTIIKDTITMHDPGVSGNAVTWRFDAFRDSSGFDFTYSDTTGKPFIDRVRPRANLAMKEAGSAGSQKFAFYHQDNNRYAQNADLFFLGGNYYVVPYDEYLDLIRYPLAFGQTFTNKDTADWVFSLVGSTPMKRYVTSTTTYDGYGTIQFKAGPTKNNISRIHIQQIIKDTVNGSGSVIPIVANTQRDIYQWFDNINKKPIMYWQKESTASNFANLVTYKVLIDNVILGFSDNKSNTDFNLYPNPSNDKLFISANKSNFVYRIFDAKGSEVLNGEINGSEKSIDITYLSKGIYFIKSDDKENTGIRFVKQ